MIQLRSVSKSFSGHGKEVIVFENFSLTIKSHSIVAILGPSGSGKTTLLNLIAALTEPDAGSLLIKSPDPVVLGFMAHEDSLLNWRTLAQNALLGTEVISNTPNPSELLETYFGLFELKKDKGTYPFEASSGMKQRVALIRTLLIQPSLLLLDEPFSSLDFDIKLKIQRVLLNYYREKKPTIVLVTHDIEDAIALADKVVMLSDKPTRIKKEIDIELNISTRDPVEARKSPQFRDYFIEIWNSLKYLETTLEDGQK